LLRVVEKNLERLKDVVRTFISRANIVIITNIREKLHGKITIWGKSKTRILSRYHH